MTEFVTANSTWLKIQFEKEDALKEVKTLKSKKITEVWSDIILGQSSIQKDVYNLDSSTEVQCS